MPTKLAAPAAVEPLSLEEVKLHLREDLEESDADIATKLLAARVHLETICDDKAFVTSEWNYFLGQFPRCNYIELPKGPLQAVAGLTYTDAAGNVVQWLPNGSNLLNADLVVMAHVDTESDPGRIVLPYGGSWPSVTLKTVNPIAIPFTAGWKGYFGTVNCDGTAVTRVSGDLFSTDWRFGKVITIGAAAYRIASVTDGNSLVLLGDASEQTGVTFQATDVPADLKNAILMLTAHWYRNRETVTVGQTEIPSTMQFAVDALIANYRY